jgi:hypothetical protein
MVHDLNMSKLGHVTGDEGRDLTIATMQKHSQFAPAQGGPTHCSKYTTFPASAIPQALGLEDIA